MAKKDDVRPVTGKSKMMVMVFQLEGDDQTIQEGLRRVGEAVQGMVRQPAKLVLKSSSAAGNGGSPQVQAGGEADKDEPEAVETEPDHVESGDEEQARSPKKEYREKPVQYVSTIDFKNAPVSLEDFAKSNKAGDGAQRRTLVCAAWLRDHAKLPEFNADDIYTCFRFVNWTTSVPDRPRKFLLNLKSREKWFDGGSKTAHFKLNHLGDKVLATPPTT